jgi:hypothetical protein
MKGKYCGIFGLNYFHLICHLILTKINCITLKIRSKADFKSKLSYSCTLQVEICSQQLESFAFASRLFHFLVESLSFCFGPGFCLLASDIFFINWTVCMSDNLPERVQILGHAHIIYITVRENRIICCQIICDLLLKSVFERIFNVMREYITFLLFNYFEHLYSECCIICTLTSDNSVFR